jgi:hypothetical protein
VLLDAFTHTSIPSDLKTIEAFEAYWKHTAKGGVFAANVISGYYGPSAHVLRHMYAAALAHFHTLDIFLASRGYSLWLPQNFLLIAQKDTDLHLRDYVRHEAVQPLDISPAEALHD